MGEVKIALSGRNDRDSPEAKQASIGGRIQPA
jgi:hypothetical protein